MGQRPLLVSKNLLRLWQSLPRDWSKEFCTGNQQKVNAGGHDIVITDDFIYKAEEGAFEGAVVVDVGHGVEGFKRYGFNSSGFRPSRAAAECIDYLVCASEEEAELRLSAYGGTQKTVVLGYPKTDDLVNAKDIYFLPNDGIKRYLYLPTFRVIAKSKSDEFNPVNKVDWAAIDTELGDDEELVIKRHSHDKTALEGEYRHIREVDPFMPTNSFIACADVCICDYSSVMMDCYIAGKPVVLFPFDLDGYSKDRGMTLDYPDEYSSYCVASESELVSMCREAAATGMRETELKLRDRLASACDGNSTERVVEFIKGLV